MTSTSTNDGKLAKIGAIDPPTTGELVAKADALVDAIRADYYKALARITTLERELEEARAKIERQATEIQRMARKIKNQRGMARTTWQIVEARSRWTRGILNRNRYLDFCTAERAKSRASQAEVERLKEALTNAADRAQQAVNTMQFNAKHMVAEDSLQDAWKMLELARQQFSTDAVSVQEAVDIARAALRVDESKT